MTSRRELRHLQVPADAWREKRKHRGRNGGSSTPVPIPAHGRRAHGQTLAASINEAIRENADAREHATFSVEGANRGVYLEHAAIPGFDLYLDGLTSRLGKDPRNHIQVAAVKDENCEESAEPEQEASQQVATTFLPEGKIGNVLKQLEAYAEKNSKKNTFDRIRSVRLATLRSLWTDSNALFPSDPEEPIWWELWLRRTDGQELARLQAYCAKAEIEKSTRSLQFHDRIITTVKAPFVALENTLLLVGDIAEVRRAREPVGFFTNLRASEQAAWIRDALQASPPPSEDAPAVAIIDTGINHGHPLLTVALSPKDCHTCHPNAGTFDDHGHGTEMAGLALYGDLAGHLASSSPPRLQHQLESIKILVNGAPNRAKDYGALTAQAVALPEISNPHRTRVFMMAITTDAPHDPGKPTSWSAAVDAIAFGRTFMPSSQGLAYIDETDDAFSRLILLSAGNVPTGGIKPNHLDASDTTPVEDPAQAWNALTIGAFTEKDLISTPQWQGLAPLAPAGELSPWSATSVLFRPTWPVKPDVVFEGGNVAFDHQGALRDDCDDLTVLTTYYKPAQSPLTTTWATSAATAQGAHFCAQIFAAYPDAWPETVRGLVVHSAEWTPAMRAHFAKSTQKGKRQTLLRRYGYGVPNLSRALNSATNSATLIVEDTINPFHKDTMNEVNIHELPWPKELLRELGDIEVRVRVTLSYFIEPNPGERGWQARYRYRSHGLEFKLKRPTESLSSFYRRVQNAKDDDEKAKSSSGNPEDYLGPTARNTGSIHSDFYHGSASDLAEQGVIAVHPVGGWWKDNRKDRVARYALIVSIETDEVSADIWSTLKVQLDTKIAVPIS